MDEPIKKRVDESWKDQAEREKHAPPAAGSVLSEKGREAPSQTAPQTGQPSEEAPGARFDLFISGLAMEALIALGDMAHPTTRKQSTNLPQAKYLIDLLDILEEKTKGNLLADETKLLKDALYQLRMRYLSKTGSAASA